MLQTFNNLITAINANTKNTAAIDFSNVDVPDARKNLNTGLVSVADYGAVADTLRLQCTVTTAATDVNVTVIPGNALCAFAATDVGKPIVIWDAGASATTALSTTIASVIDAAHITVAPAPGQTITGLTKYVSWGTDNKTAIQAAYNQAAKQVSATGQQGLVYFPPTTTTSGGAEEHLYYGTTGNVGFAPGGYRIATLGGGAFKSVVMALAPISSALAFESSAYADGNSLRDIGFDGNMVTAVVGWLRCSPNSHLDNVRFSTAAPGGITLQVGEIGAACPGTVGVHVLLDSTLNTGFGTAYYPDKHLDLFTTDTQWFGLIPSGRATTNQIHVESGAGNTLFVGPHTGQTATGGVAIQIDASVVQLYDPQIDNAAGNAITGININAASVKIFGGRLQSPNAGTVGITIGTNRAGTGITGFDCNRFSTAANCIKAAYPMGANSQITANGSSTIVPQTSQVTNVSVTTSDLGPTGVMAGIGGTITPVQSNFMILNAQGDIKNSISGSGYTVALRYGTGAVPNAGDVCSGNAAGAAVEGTVAAVNQKVPFALSGRATPVPGVPQWYDLCLFATTSGTIVAEHLTMRAVEYFQF